jgi:hypothetical protein
MEIFEKQFTNELGNSIHVQVKSKEIEGVPGVVIAISGPHSSTENHVTQLEAEVICEQLKLLLQK